MASKSIEDLYPTPYITDHESRSIKGNFIESVHDTITNNEQQIITYKIKQKLEQNRCYGDVNIDCNYHKIELIIGGHTIDTLYCKFIDVLKKIYTMDTIPIHIFKTGIPSAVYNDFILKIHGCTQNVNITYNVYELNCDNTLTEDHTYTQMHTYTIFENQFHQFNVGQTVAYFNNLTTLFVTDNSLQQMKVNNIDFPIDKKYEADMEIIKIKKNNGDYINFSRIDMIQLNFDIDKLTEIIVVSLNTIRFGGGFIGADIAKTCY
jgi:hypothetical protein